jgi:hypothetical protein
MSEVRMDDAADPLGWLLRPLTAGDFERRYYQQRFCVIHRDAPGYYRDLLSVGDLDRVLGTHGIRHPDLQIVRFEEEIPASEYTSGEEVVDPLRAAKLFADGATLVFSHLHTRVPPLARFCAALSQVLSSKMQANIYFTPPDAQGFKPHWDTHDVFVLQISGSKRWMIYETRFRLPLRGQKFDPKKDPPPSAPIEEFELRAGDLLYIPRGVMHAARATAEPSLHVTAGLMAFTWADFFLQGVAEAALADESLRENLPLGFARAEFPPAERARLVREKAGRLGDRLASDPPFPYFSTEVASFNRPCLGNLLGQMTQLPHITLATTVQRRPDAVWDLRETESGCTVRCFGKEIQLPAFIAPALRFALSGARFSVGEMPDCVDAAGKVTLVRRLVKEGLFECVEAGA